MDSIVYNELGDPTAVAAPEDLALAATEDSTRGPRKFKFLNLSYDLTPASLIPMVITEVGTLPASSVAAVLRENMDRGKD